MDIESLRAIRDEAAEVAKSLSDRRVRQLAGVVAALAAIIIEAHDTLTTTAACELLDLAPGAVRQLVRRGRLTARHEGRELRITRESAEAFAADRRPRKKIGK